MTDKKMEIWNALKATDPKYTKPVTFGRKFTSINSQWQLQRMTEEFGPVGLGWGYTVAHSVERITEEYVLAIADVSIWWDDGDDKNHYGPIRGMSPILERGKNGLHFDDDAGKKAMTDALTKGLSHIGLSADVFLGLFDDNKYVQAIAKEFSDPPKPAAMELIDPLDRDMVKGDGRSAYQMATAEKPPGRLAAEFWASQVLGMLKMPGTDVLAYRDWLREPCTPKGTKDNAQKLAELREKHADLADKIDTAASDLRVTA